MGSLKASETAVETRAGGSRRNQSGGDNARTKGRDEPEEAWEVEGVLQWRPLKPRAG